MNLNYFVRVCLLLFIPMWQGCDSKTDQAAGVPVDTVPLTLRISQCSRLYTAEYKIHKIVTFDDILKVKGSFFQKNFTMKVPIGERKIAIPMDVTLKAYVDLSYFSEKNIVKQGKRIRITLPDPRVTVTSSKIDNYRVKQYTDLTRTRFTESEISDYARQGLESVVQTIPDLGILTTARDNAARTLIPLIQSMGYQEEDIIISFRKEFTREDLPFLLDLESVKSLK